MTDKEMAAALERYVEAVNRHDIDAMLELRHPQAYLELMGTGVRVEGRDGLRTFYESFYGSLMPDYQLEVTGSAFTDDTGVVWGQYTATAPPDFLGTGSDGGPVTVPVCFVCTFEDGMFHGDHMYADALAPARQTGADIPPQAAVAQQQSTAV